MSDDRKDGSIVQVGRDDCWAQLRCARHTVHVVLAGCMESVYVLLVSLVYSFTVTVSILS